MAHNARVRDRLWFFEIGPVYLPAGPLELPLEPRRRGVGMAGPVVPVSWGDHAPAQTDFFFLNDHGDLLLQEDCDDECKRYLVVVALGPDIKKNYHVTTIYLLGVQRRGRNRGDWAPNATSPGCSAGSGVVR